MAKEWILFNSTSATASGLPHDSDATVTIFVVAGPVLFPQCDPFGTAVALDWSLDTNVQQMVQHGGLNIKDFIIYRSAVSGSNYTAIATNTTIQMSYLDASAVVGQTNYYVVNFESANSTGAANYESPLSNEIKASGRNPDDLIPPNAVWNVVTNLSNPTNVVRLQAPFFEFWHESIPKSLSVAKHLLARGHNLVQSHRAVYCHQLRATVAGAILHRHRQRL
ncbi:MAG: hypothetical protein WDM80_06730 [Limisphaerales bacterium]